MQFHSDIWQMVSSILQHRSKLGLQLLKSRSVDEQNSFMVKVSDCVFWGLMIVLWFRVCNFIHVWQVFLSYGFYEGVPRLCGHIIYSNDSAQKFYHVWDSDRFVHISDQIFKHLVLNRIHHLNLSSSAFSEKSHFW